jgi:YHS domain-containing protein
MAIDPICKMTVDEKTARFTSVYKGKTYYFCAPGCKKTFEMNPEQYVTEQEECSYHHLFFISARNVYPY